MEIILVTGRVNSGKTTLLKKLVERERLRKNFPSGIIAHGIFQDGAKIGFAVQDLSTGISKPLAIFGKNAAGGFSFGRFSFRNESLDFARNALLNFGAAGTVFLDEVGPLELRGGGYAVCLEKLLGSDIQRLYISVRRECMTEFQNKFLSSVPVRIVETDA